MPDLEEVTMTFIPLVKRDHPRWTTNRCKIEAVKLARKFVSAVSSGQVSAKKTDWSRVKNVAPIWDISSKLLRER